MIPFLSSFLRNLPAIQTKQVLRLLSQMRDKGEIRTHQDFQQKLNDLAKIVQSDQVIQQTPVMTFEDGDLLESDAVRTFVEMVRLDMESGLGETERLSNAIRAHHRILTENYFDALEAAVEELESEIRAYEVLDRRKYTGFSGVLKQYNFTGAIAVPGADDDDPFTSSLFSDSRGNEDLYYSPPRNGEPGLHLGIDPYHSEYVHYFDSVEILTDSTTPATMLSVATDDNVPLRAIDGSLDTAWKHSILLTEYVSTCRMKLGLSFATAQRANALIIDPLADVPMKIANISYIDSGGTEVDLNLGTVGGGSRGCGSGSISGHLGTIDTSDKQTEWIIPNRRQVIVLGDVIVKKIILTLQQDTAADGEFFYDVDLGSWKKGGVILNALQETEEAARQFMATDAAETLGYFNNPNGYARRARFAEYVFGLKEVSVLEREYISNGLFVPEPFELSKAPQTLALHRIAEFPSAASDIEFLIKKENFDSEGTLLDVETIPIQPYGDDSVDERLFLSYRVTNPALKDTGLTRFYPDFDKSFKVYRDTTELIIGTDYEISVDGGVTWETSTPPSGTSLTPATCQVKIRTPRTDTIFRVAYTPLVSSSSAGGEVWLNPLKTVKLDRFQVYSFENERPYGSVSSCRLALQIITRANTLNTRVSPFLREVVLLGG